MTILFQCLLVAAGSAVGGLTRWIVTVVMGRWCGTAFPWGTLFINVSGSMFLGWLMTLIGNRLSGPANSWIQAQDLRLALAVGFTGAYTTFSTYEFESYLLLKDGSGILGAAYLAGSVFLGLLAVRVGVLLAGTGHA
ncbi:MAG: CrcB family protein [Gemmataceae bacterium]|nr:CrcB family protein [Gemmataceae bacterium]